MYKKKDEIMFSRNFILKSFEINSNFDDRPCKCSLCNIYHYGILGYVYMSLSLLSKTYTAHLVM